MLRGNSNLGRALIVAALLGSAGMVEASEADLILPEEFYLPTPLRLPPEADREARASALYLQALFEEESEGPDKALETKRQALALVPGFSSLAVETAHQYLRRGQTLDAISVLKDAAKANTEDPSPALALSSLYLRQLQKPELAEKYALQALTSAPDLPEPYEALWEVYRSSSQRQKITSLFQRAAKRENDDPGFWLQLADLRLRDAAVDGKQSPEELAAVQSFLEQAVQSRADAETLARAADYFVLCGRVPRATELYQSALDERANLEGVKEKLAACLLETGNTAGAVAVIEKIVKANPLDLRAYDQLAQLHLKTGDMTRALTNLRQALLIAPPDPRRFEDAIRLALAAQDSKAALDLADEAAGKFPKNIEFSLYRGLALSLQERHEEAIKAFEFTLVEAGNSRPDLLDADFYFGYGVAAEQAGRTVKASELFLKSIELDPKRSARACNYLGYMWADRNENLDEAEKLIRRALELEPDNGAFVDSLGWVLFRKGQYDAALAELLRAAELLQEPDAVVFEHIGDTYEKLGRTAEAVLYWQKALQVAPGTGSLTKKIDANSSRIVQKPAEPAR